MKIRWILTLGIVLVCFMGAGREKVYSREEEHTHQYRWVEYTSPICTVEGWGYDICECGAIANGKTLPAQGHVYEKYVIVEGDCVTPAILGVRCSVCGWKGATESGSPNPHKHAFVIRCEDVYDNMTSTWKKENITYCKDCGRKL